MKTDADEQSPSNKLEECQTAWICLSYSFWRQQKKYFFYRRWALFTVLWFLMYNKVKESNEPLNIF